MFRTLTRKAANVQRPPASSTEGPSQQHARGLQCCWLGAFERLQTSSIFFFFIHDHQIQTCRSLNPESCASSRRREQRRRARHIAERANSSRSSPVAQEKTSRKRCDTQASSEELHTSPGKAILAQNHIVTGLRRGVFSRSFLISLCCGKHFFQSRFI